jgi:hypothetical protein
MLKNPDGGKPGAHHGIYTNGRYQRHAAQLVDPCYDLAGPQAFGQEGDEKIALLIACDCHQERGIRGS